MNIIGAGMSGLLCARRLQSHHPTIFEQQESLPNNHSALLRFRTDEVSKATGIPFKKVRVYKGILDQRGNVKNIVTIRDINAYSEKVVSRTMARSITSLDSVDRWIAPHDFIHRLSVGIQIEYGCLNWRDGIGDNPTISTIPMARLAEILGYSDALPLSYTSVWNINCELPLVDVYQTMYIPYQQSIAYRASITGNRLTIECSQEPVDTLYEIQNILDRMGINTEPLHIETREQQYGKIVPLDDNIRKRFILWASDFFDVYSLGRFATWRNILMDDVLKDIDIIQQMIMQRSDYHRKLHYTGE